MRRALYWGLCLAVVNACGDDQGPVGASGTATEGSGDSGDPSTGTAPSTVDDTGTAGSSSNGEEETTAAPAGDEPFAQGIRLTRVTANQAVQVELVRDGIEIAPADYNTRIITGRRTLLRAFWSLHADFVPRELIGRLTVDYPDGTQLVQDFPLMVEGESNDGGTSFQWLLEPDQIVPGMLYRIKVVEADPEAAQGELSEPPPILPLAGRGSLGIYDVPLEMEVVLIPVLHQFEGERCMPQIGEEDILAMQHNLEQNNPVQRALITVGDPMPYTDPIGSSGMGFSPVLTALAQRRAMDDAPPWVYYYGLQDPCDGYPPGLLGQAIGIPPIPPTPEAGQQRISTGRWSGSGEAASETFVHEVGHSQGRYHVLCSGGEAGADMAYPHPNGRIGVWGFGIHDFQLRSPTGGRDYMTYCSNEWVSDYAWEQTLGVIEILTMWSEAGAPPSTGEGLLLGAIEVDGSEQWWTAPGGLDPELATPDAALVVEYEQGEEVLPVWIYERPDSDTVQVIAPRPAGFGDVQALDLVRPDRVAPSRLPLDEIRDLYAQP